LNALYDTRLAPYAFDFRQAYLNKHLAEFFIGKESALDRLIRSSSSSSSTNRQRNALLFLLLLLLLVTIASASAAAGDASAAASGI